MHRYLWLFPVIAVMAIAGGLIATREPSKAAAIVPAPASAPLPVVAKTKTRNVYDGTTKVGELTFTIQKYTSSTDAWVKLLAGSLVFEVTNDDYKTPANPFPAVENIPLADGAEDEKEALGEHGGCNIGDLGFDDDRYFVLSVSSANASWTWDEFFTDPLDCTDMLTVIGYKNYDLYDGDVKQLIVKEES